jgi:hypothetical protein
MNGLFFVYWLLQFKKRMILSGLVLLIGITFINKFYKFSSNELPVDEKDFTVMSYNVHLFNVFKWIDRDDVPTEILAFVNEKNPDILCIQEYSSSANIDFKVNSATDCPGEMYGLNFVSEELLSAIICSSYSEKYL